MLGSVLKWFTSLSYTVTLQGGYLAFSLLCLYVCNVCACLCVYKCSTHMEIRGQPWVSGSRLPPYLRQGLFNICHQVSWPVRQVSTPTFKDEETRLGSSGSGQLVRAEMNLKSVLAGCHHCLN